MGTDRVGVAISTTGDEHRLRFLETCVERWDAALPQGASLFVTVDGSDADTERVAALVSDQALVYRVGQVGSGIPDRLRYSVTGRMGVAVNKNTGLELLMDQTDVVHLFLSDDDTWPVSKDAIKLHTQSDLSHSLVCWGLGRFERIAGRHAEWSWPRGVVQYARRAVVERVGGMDEAFGPGGHEHAEWSMRIHNAGLTPARFCSPAVYAGGRATDAALFWHAEDMRRAGESQNEHSERRRSITSVRRQPGDWARIKKVMRSREGSSEFVPYRAAANGRVSATISSHT